VEGRGGLPLPIGESGTSSGGRGKSTERSYAGASTHFFFHFTHCTVLHCRVQTMRESS